MSNFGEDEWYGNLAAKAYREAWDRDGAVKIMLEADHSQLSEFQAQLMWEAIDAYANDGG